jgi:hypothetical protein
MSVVHPVIKNLVILIAVIQYVLWFDVLVLLVAFMKRDRMAEALYMVWRKQTIWIPEILELTHGYINAYNSLGKRHQTHNTISKAVKLTLRIHSLVRKVVYINQSGQHTGSPKITRIVYWLTHSCDS